HPHPAPQHRPITPHPPILNRTRRPPPPRPTHSPYPTLFRPHPRHRRHHRIHRRRRRRRHHPSRHAHRLRRARRIRTRHLQHQRRSEEHTSQLQSRENLVCRLLLAKPRPITPQPLIRKRRRRR